MSSRSKKKKKKKIKKKTYNETFVNFSPTPM